MRHFSSLLLLITVGMGLLSLIASPIAKAEIASDFTIKAPNAAVSNGPIIDAADDKKSSKQKSSIKKNKAKSKKRTTYKRSGICKDLDRLARIYKLPPLFFARLIWQESRFNPYAVSPAGAQGIAQFMPGTAAIWGLDDPFEPGQALIKSAQYLSYLHQKLGNLGYAAAGYNAGSGRVTNWIKGSNYMPLETRNYVRIITGYTIDQWAGGKVKFTGIKVKKKMSATACNQLTIALRVEKPNFQLISYGANGKRRSKDAKRLPRMPWGVQLAGSFSKRQAMKQFHSIKRKFSRIIGDKRIVIKSSRQKGRGRRIFHRVRIGANSRTAANTVCRRLRSAGGNCVVMRN
jgi:Transglycosylase SLT domain/SPOR domain